MAAVSIEELINEKEAIEARKKRQYDVETSAGTFTMKPPSKSFVAEVCVELFPKLRVVGGVDIFRGAVLFLFLCELLPCLRLALAGLGRHKDIKGEFGALFRR